MRNAITEQTTGLGVAGQGQSKNYWDEYRDFWDRFIAKWFDERPNEPTDKDTQVIKRWVKKLNLDELPEPYLGAPEKGVKAVIINLNPGMSQTDEEEESLECQKFYSLRNKYQSKGPFVRDSLIKDFSDRCHKRYSEFVKSWSCLDPKYRREDTNLCGVKWWQGVDPAVLGGRMKWLARIYEKEPDVATSIHVDVEGVGKLNPLEVFALELCPYHSKSFSFDEESAFNSDDETINVLPFIVDRVFKPAFNAVVENPSIPFAVAIGKAFAVLLEKISRSDKFTISAKLEKEWWDESDGAEEWKWPKSRNKGTGELRRVYRKYCLFALKDKNGRLARFLVCAAPGSNNTPGKEFEKIERKQILPYVRATRLTNELYEELKPFSLRWWSYDEEDGLSRIASKKTRGVNGNRKQLYKNLWERFYNWCTQHNKDWFMRRVTSDYNANSIDPSGGGNPHLFFKIAGGQLYLGIYCTVSTHTKIQESCAEEINAAYAGVDWNDGEARKTWRCIPIPIDGDWTNPDEVLFEKMAAAFENVGSILQEHGLRITK